jgi:branched-chain amino acid transport system ATP-binding protein
MRQETQLRLENIYVHYNGVKALNGISLHLKKGEIVALMGPNGAGKSTILKAIFGLAPIETGTVFCHEEQIAPQPYKVAKLGIAFVPQGRRIFRHLTVLENMEMGGVMIRDKNTIKARLGEMMGIFPALSVKKHAKAGVLSGGEQQMLAIARGMIMNPGVLLLDEPSLGLSPKMVKEVFQKIGEINRKHKTTIMVVEHNIRSVLDISSRIYILDKGKIAFEGPSGALLRNNALSKIFEEVFLGKYNGSEVV